MNFIFRRLPNILADSIVLIFALIYKIITLNLFLSISNKEINLKPVAILGNGPSLKKDIVEVIDKKNEMDIYAVNYFANTDYFKELKPSYYFLVDPVFWKTGINRDITDNNEKLIRNLMNVDWKMNLICRTEGYFEISKRLKLNSNLSIEKIKSNWYDLRSEKANIFALKQRLCSPNFVNVLIAAIWHALINERKNINIYGADFSSFKELYVDQKKNTVFTSSSHFYKESFDLASIKEKYIGIPPKRINVRFYQIWQGFRQMFFLSKVAQSWGAKVINKSSFSYIDSFDRS